MKRAPPTGNADAPRLRGWGELETPQTRRREKDGRFRGVGMAVAAAGRCLRATARSKGRAARRGSARRRRWMLDGRGSRMAGAANWRRYGHAA